MFMRIVVPLEGNRGDLATLDVAQERARQYTCPIHLIRFVDVSHLVRIGCHGPAMDVSACRTTLPDAHGQARDYVAAVANALTARGFRVTHEIRQGLLQFELPAAMRPGDLIVTSVETRVGRGDTSGDPLFQREGIIVLAVGASERTPELRREDNLECEECESFEFPQLRSLRTAETALSRR